MIMEGMPIFAVSTTLLLLFHLLAFDLVPAESSDIRLGQGIAVGESWVSEGRIFALGFKSVTGSTDFSLAIWYVFDPETIVWTAKSLGSDQPLLVTEDANLILTNDALVVNQGVGPEGLQSVWKTVIISCDQCISKARISDTGNFVMLDAQDGILWQSFDSPTNTLLPGQQLVGSMTLEAGKYSLELNPIQVMLRYKDYPTQPYWSITNPSLSVTNFSSLNILPRFNMSSDGVLTFYDGTGNAWNTSMRHALDHMSSNVLTRRLTLDARGSLEMFSVERNSSSWITVWKAVFMECDIFGACGEFGICSYTPAKTCRCPPGFHRIDQTDPSAGCAYDIPLHCNATNNKFVRLVRADYPWNDYNFDAKLVMPLEGCMESCLKDCNCLAAAYKYQGTDLCFHKGNAGKLFNGIQTAFLENFVLLKVAGESQVEGVAYSDDQNNNDAFVTDTEEAYIALFHGSRTLTNNTSRKHIYYGLLAIAIAEGVFILAIVMVWMIKLKT